MLKLSNEQITRFNEDGFLIVEGMVDDATVARLRACFDALFRGEFE